MDLTQALKDTENSLRDFIATVLSKRFGDDWAEKCGVSQQRITAWRERKQVEEKRQVSGVVEERLIYYADFYDLKTILKKHWSLDFSPVFGDWKTMEVWLTEMERLRDPDAHRRELLPHQKHLALGIAGEIRTRLIRYRSKMETSEDYFPRIESARDSLGNTWTYGQTNRSNHLYRLRPGDFIEFIITASDPIGGNLQYALTVTGYHHNPNWQDSNTLSLTIEASHVRRDFGVMLWLRSLREFHAIGDYDDSVTFQYEVLPPRS
ncbi:MAG: hypothetical protein KME10_05480 [Plectolyngbya sp. WJT66-NPBG17]|jgi:hypothetical protein|nr:hypothetical protein [Plectolyngbya sp. WJT66-NPBG17]